MSGKRGEGLTDEESGDPSFVLPMSPPLLETEERVAHLRRPGYTTMALTTATWY